MVICGKCLKEMKCVKTGAVIHFGNGHVYMGDIFECCGAEIVNCNSQSVFLDERNLQDCRDRGVLIEVKENGEVVIYVNYAR